MYHSRRSWKIFSFHLVIEYILHARLCAEDERERERGLRLDSHFPEILVSYFRSYKKIIAKNIYLFTVDHMGGKPKSILALFQFRTFATSLYGMRFLLIAQFWPTCLTLLSWVTQSCLCLLTLLSPAKCRTTSIYIMLHIHIFWCFWVVTDCFVTAETQNLPFINSQML